MIKIISGGQTGADLAALRFAKFVGLQTGGWMPLGWWTQNGPKPEYETLYGMQECQTKGYPARTYNNVRDSDATIRFAKDFNSPGEICTLGAINTHKKPYFDVDVTKLMEPVFRCGVMNNLLLFLNENKVSTLNVAGNSEKTCYGIECMVGMFLMRYHYYYIDMMGK